MEITNYVQIYPSNILAINQLDTIQQKFIPFAKFTGTFETQQNYFFQLIVQNTDAEKLSAYLDLGNWSFIDVYSQSPDNQWIIQKGGYFLPLSARNVPRAYPLVKLEVLPHTTQLFYLRVSQKMAFYLPTQQKFYWHNDVWFNQENQPRLFYQGIFLGIILVMALYNLVIYFSVKDVSFLYYVLSLAGIGLYFLFYYGFALELLWQNLPYWNAHSFAVIVPLTRIFWVLFTQTYLHLSEILPSWNKVLNYLIILYLVPIFSGLFNYLFDYDTSEFTVAWIGVMGVLVLSMMILMGILSYRQGYQPALYFLIANMFFSFGSIMFILREVGFLTDTFITRYSVQIGVILQTTLFSLGLADRLNQAQKAIIQKDLEKANLEREKEIEKKQLIENQRLQLENEVKERTADLQEKTEELEITVQKLQESEKNLLELNHIKDKFFSIISHDLRSPMATLNSFLNILVNFSDNFSPDELQNLARRTQKSVGGLTELLDNLLQWARSQMNHLQFEPQTINLYQIVYNTANLLTVSIEEKQIDLKIEIAENLQVFADQNMLSFVFRNLLINALKFTPPKGKINIDSQVSDNQLVIKISDTGIGIPPENLANLFLVHKHFSTRGTQNEKGVGLGLLLCKEFIEKHGGKIAVQSEEGKGTTFSFSLAQIA
ncbi:MAG: sensor histidine kinase [Microscillaceae bacterium]|nr:sensor histidine kinase [Microscillaceae bacterium]